jgi:hypothetical protein
MASMDGEAVMLHEDECADVALPAEVYVLPSLTRLHC